MEGNRWRYWLWEKDVWYSQCWAGFPGHEILRWESCPVPHGSHFISLLAKQASVPNRWTLGLCFHLRGVVCLEHTWLWAILVRIPGCIVALWSVNGMKMGGFAWVGYMLREWRRTVLAEVLVVSSPPIPPDLSQVAVKNPIWNHSWLKEFLC